MTTLVIGPRASGSSERVLNKSSRRLDFHFEGVASGLGMEKRSGGKCRGTGKCQSLPPRSRPRRQSMLDQSDSHRGEEPCGFQKNSEDYTNGTRRERKESTPKMRLRRRSGLRGHARGACTAGVGYGKNPSWSCTPGNAQHLNGRRSHGGSVMTGVTESRANRKGRWEVVVKGRN